jgi:hypothetical protein
VLDETDAGGEDKAVHRLATKTTKMKSRVSRVDCVVDERTPDLSSGNCWALVMVIAAENNYQLEDHSTSLFCYCHSVDHAETSAERK